MSLARQLVFGSAAYAAKSVPISSATMAMVSASKVLHMPRMRSAAHRRRVSESDPSRSVMM